MEKNLGEVIEEISAEGKTGILSISVKNDNCLFKVFFRNGNVYHITHGTCRDSECLYKIPALDMDAGFFMSGAQVDIKTVDIPGTQDIIKEAKNSQKMVNWGAQSMGRSEKVQDKGAARSVVDNGIIGTLEEELLNIAGPVANMVLESVYGACNLKKDGPISGVEFKRLVQMISEKLPDEQKTVFMMKFADYL